MIEIGYNWVKTDDSKINYDIIKKLIFEKDFSILYNNRVFSKENITSITWSKNYTYSIDKEIGFYQIIIKTILQVGRGTIHDEIEISENKCKHISINNDDKLIAIF